MKKTIKAHNKRVAYKRGHTHTKTFIGGIVIGIIAWELGGLLTDLIIQVIK